MDLIEELCRDLRARGAAASTPQSLADAVTQTLSEMVQSSAGMVHGRVVTPNVVAQANAALAKIADELFDTLSRSDRVFARNWLGLLPKSLWPDGGDLARWRKVLEVPETQQEWLKLRQRSEDDQQRLLLERIGGPSSPLTPENIETLFDCRLPRELRAAWAAAIDGTNNFELLTGSPKELLRAAFFVNEPHLVGELRRAPGKPFTLLPFAQVTTSHGLFTLDLGSPNADGDFRVLVPTRTDLSFGSSREWLQREGTVVRLTALLAFKASGQERDEEWCGEVLREKAPELLDDGAAVAAAIERFLG